MRSVIVHNEKKVMWSIISLWRHSRKLIAWLVRYRMAMVAAFRYWDFGMMAGARFLFFHSSFNVRTSSDNYRILVLAHWHCWLPGYSYFLPVPVVRACLFLPFMIVVRG